MKSYFIENVKLLNIKKNNKLYYGASQLWYKYPFKRLAACGPTTASNLFIYLAKNDDYFKNLFTGNLDYYDVFAFQKLMWEYITPTLKGVYSISMFDKGGKKFFKSKNINVKEDVLYIDKDNKVDIDVLKDYLVRNILTNRPIAFLNLCAKNVVESSDWHWVLKVGLSYDNDSVFVYLYDEGFRRRINLSKWLVNTSKDGGFITYMKE